MTIKIKAKPPKRRARPTKTGWHSLTTDELLLWAYMWFERTGNARFSEPARQSALRLHTTHPTLLRHLQALININVVYPDAGRMKDGWIMTAKYTVTEPPAAVLRFVDAIWNLDAERGKARPGGPKVDHDRTRINSGDARGARVDQKKSVPGLLSCPSE